jgi:hypothetical protein
MTGFGVPYNQSANLKRKAGISHDEATIRELRDNPVRNEDQGGSVVSCQFPVLSLFFRRRDFEGGN